MTDPASRDEEARSRQRRKSVAIALGVAFLAALFYVITVVRLQEASR